MEVASWMHVATKLHEDCYYIGHLWIRAASIISSHPFVYI